MAVWNPTQYFGTLLAAITGNAMRRTEGQQNSGGSGGQGAGHIVNAETALKLSAVWACIKIISEAVGAMPMRVWRYAPDGSRELDTTHWLNRLFESPNRYQTRNEFFETLVISLQSAGNSYIEHERYKDGRILALTPLMPLQTEVVLMPAGGRGYKYTDGRIAREIAQDNMWHLMLMPSNATVGLSPLQYGARTMGIAIAAEDRMATLARNGFKPTGVLMLDHVLKQDQRDALRKQYSDLAEGQGDPLKILEAGMTYQQVSMSPKDVELLANRHFSIEDIARFFGVPSVLINDTSATTVWGSGISEIKEGFYTLTLQPLCERIESSISKWLIPVGEQGIVRCEFDFSAFLRGNETTRTTQQAAAVNGNLLTINEARAIEGRPPVPGGDVMYAQSQMIPIGTKPPANGIVDRRKVTT